MRKRKKKAAGKVFERAIERMEHEGIGGLVFAAEKDIPDNPVIEKREELKTYLEGCGAKLTNTISARTDYLITNHPDGTDEKTFKANELGIDKISWHDFFELSGITVNGCIIRDGCVRKYIDKNPTSVTIPEGITSIGDSAFEKCRRLTSIEIPGSVTEIGWGAFKECWSLTSIEIPGSVTKIGESVFEGCSSLKSIKIPESVTEIGRYAFKDCYRLNSINIPNGVKEIGEAAFKACRALKSIEIPESVTMIRESAFLGCTAITSITLTDKCRVIGDEAFREYKALKQVVVRGSSIPECVKKSFGNMQITMESGDGKTVLLDMPKSTQAMLIYVTTGLDDDEEEKVKRIVERMGGCVKSSVSGETDWLIVNENYDHVTVKLAKARELAAGGGKIRIISYKDFIKQNG